MRMGSKVSREIWRGKISYIEIANLALAKGIRIHAPDGSSRILQHMESWDILATDWWIVP